jgi:hypothetical protein
MQVLYCSDSCRVLRARVRSKVHHDSSRESCECGGLKQAGSKWCRGCRKGRPYKLKPALCVVCGIEYQPKIRYQKCCGAACGQVLSALSTMALHGITTVTESRRRVQERRRKGSASRAAKLRRVGGRLVPGRWRGIGERDGWMCWLCQTAVDPAAPLNGKDGPTVDHVVPLAEGGSDDDSNVRLAHRSCNCRRRQRGRLTRFERMEAA